ncbi:MAG: hypothetical protein H8E57_03730 [Candidatus Cloacimonetes bacterium]|nr:hypothetical protein [Candidatus Cloacimonadota bacterium]
MQNKSKNSKWTRAEKLSLLRFITPFLVYFLNLIPKMKNALMILSKKFELKLSSLNLLIVFILLLLMILILYFRNKIKEKKTNRHKPPPIYQKTYQELPPKKYMDSILLLISNSEYLHINDICDSFHENKNVIIHYTDSLYSNNYVSRYDSGNWTSSLIPIDQLPFELAHKGREYLIKNKLIN